MQSRKNLDMGGRMENFVQHKVMQMTSLSELPAKVAAMLPQIMQEVAVHKPNPIVLITTSKENVHCTKHAGHYFMGGLPALMQAVRLLQKDSAASVSYVNDGQLKKSTQSAHQGHVHPTEWTTPELGTLALVKILLQNLCLLPKPAPEDILNYSYIHLPLSKLRPSLLAKNMIFRLVHTLLSKNGVSEDDRWQCEAVRASLAFHKALSEEIEAAGGEPTYAAKWRLIWWPEKEGIERKKKIWSALGIQTAPLSYEELRTNSLLKDDIPLYGLKVLEDGKFFANVDHKICAHLEKKYAHSFHVRTASVTELYLDEQTGKPFAVQEMLPDGSQQLVSIDSFYGSCGHNQVFKDDKRLWDEVPVTGVSTLWTASIEKQMLIDRLGALSDADLASKVRQFVGTTNLTNLHMTIWDACVEGDVVHVIARATQGANFNSELADPDDLYNMTANINRFFIGKWTLLSAGSCTRKTTTANVPELTENFIHGLSGIGFSFSAAPKEMLQRSGLTSHLFSKLLSRCGWPINWQRK